MSDQNPAAARATRVRRRACKKSPVPAPADRAASAPSSEPPVTDIANEPYAVTTLRLPIPHMYSA